MKPPETAQYEVWKPHGEGVQQLVQSRWCGDPEAVRALLLTRIRDALVRQRIVLETVNAMAECCWLSYPYQGRYALWRICDQRTCTHSHHHAEIFIG